MQKQNMMITGILRKMSFYMMVLIIWVLGYKLVNFPSLLNVLEKILILIHNNVLFKAITISMERIIFGYIISLIIGLIVGLIMSKLTYTGENVSNLMASLQSMPNVCWVPFAILWFGFNEKAILFSIIIGSVFAVAISTESAIKNLNPMYLRVAKMTGAKGYNLYKNVIIPASMPRIIIGLRQGWAFAWRGLISGEMISSLSGLGQILSEGKKHNDINEIVAIMLVIIILGLLFDKLIFENLQNRVNYKFGTSTKI